jgi:hypothetical protein
MARSSTSGLGRPKGSLNKATADVMELAGVYSAAAITRLAELAGLVEGKKAADTHQAQISALRELLDRGHGKPVQAVQHSGGITLGGLIEDMWGARDTKLGSNGHAHVPPATVN